MERRRRREKKDRQKRSGKRMERRRRRRKWKEKRRKRAAKGLCGCISATPQNSEKGRVNSLVVRARGHEGGWMKEKEEKSEKKRKRKRKEGSHGVFRFRFDRVPQHKKL